MDIFRFLFGWIWRRNSSGAAKLEEYDEEEAQQEASQAAHRQRVLEGQVERESKARQSGIFVKNQRVRYFHKASQQWIDDAHVVGVHHDDGADRPYYTIQYRNRPDDSSSVDDPPQPPMEKQTTHDRLEAAEWDEEKTWSILSKGKA